MNDFSVSNPLGGPGLVPVTLTVTAYYNGTVVGQAKQTGYILAH